MVLILVRNYGKMRLTSLVSGEMIIIVNECWKHYT